MLEINKTDIINKGLDYIKGLELFEFKHEYHNDYPIWLNDIKYLFNITVVPLESGRGFKETFTKKSIEQLESEALERDLNAQISVIENRFNVRLVVQE